MKVTVEQLKIWEDAAKNFCTGYPAVQGIIEAVEMMSPPDNLRICLLNVDELKGWSTVCGRLDNVCFDSDVIDFLKEHNVRFALVGIIPDDDDTSNYLIAGGALPLTFGDDSTKLSEMISERNGSWRDDCCIEGWSSYESE